MIIVHFNWTPTPPISRVTCAANSPPFLPCALIPSLPYPHNYGPHFTRVLSSYPKPESSPSNRTYDKTLNRTGIRLPTSHCWSQVAKRLTKSSPPNQTAFHRGWVRLWVGQIRWSSGGLLLDLRRSSVSLSLSTLFGRSRSWALWINAYEGLPCFGGLGGRRLFRNRYIFGRFEAFLLFVS